MPADIDQRIYENLMKQTYDLTNHHFQKNIYVNLSKLSSEETSAYSTLINSISLNNPNEKIYENLCSTPIYVNLKDVIDKHAETDKTHEKFELNKTPNCHDKSDIYRTKMSSTMTRIFPSIRQRRSLHRPRRYRRRSTTPFRSNSNRRQQQQQQAMSSKQRTRKKSVTNKLYNEISQTEEIFAYPIQFQQILAYCPTKQILPQICSTSENGEESIRQEEEEDEAEEEKEQQLYQHKTFEDFLLCRPKSTNSTVASITNTIISSETLSHELPFPSKPLDRRSSGLTLSLDKKDVDFIHDIIQRTHGNQRVSNRIVALKEAYLRAQHKRNELLKTQKPLPTNVKKKINQRHSVIASKIRNELEKYDELPVHQKKYYSNDEDDEYEYEETYSINDDDYNYYHHRRLPATPSKTHRFIHFIVSLKRQIQKNLQDIRERFLLESISHSRHRQQFYNSRDPSYHHRPRTSYHHHQQQQQQQQQLSRNHAKLSHLHSLPARPRTFRVTPHLQRRELYY